MKSQRWLSINFFTFFFTWGIFMPYWTGWLVNGKGLTVPQAGIIMSLGMIIRALSTLVIYPMATKRYSLSKVMQMSAIMALVGILFYLPFHTYTALLIVTILFSAIYPTILPAVESSASTLIQTDKIHYGKARSYGSIGYTVALVVVGGVTQLYGVNAVLWVMIVGIILIIGSQFLKTPSALSQKPERVQNASSLTYIDLFKEKGFFIVFFISVLLQGAHASYNNYGYVFLSDLHIKGFAIGLILNVAVIIEIILFLFADRFLPRMKVSTLYTVAAIGSTIRWILIFLFPTVEVFIASQLLHAVSFGVAHFAFIQYISQRLDKKFIPMAQAVYAAFSMSLSIAALTLLGGFLYDIEPKYAFAGMLICSVPALILTLTTNKKYRY